MAKYKYTKALTIEVNGKKKRKYFYANTEKELFKKIRDYTAKDNNAVSVSVVANEWQGWIEDRVGNYTYECYKAPLKDIINEFGERKIKELEIDELQAFIDDFAFRGKAKQTVKLRHQVLTAIFQYAVRKKYIEINKNPMIYVNVPKGLKNGSYGTITKDTEQRIVDGDASLLVTFIYYTGLRRGEVSALNCDDIDYINNKITVNKVIEYHGAMPKLRQGAKNDTSIREVMMPNILKERLIDAGCDKRQGILFVGNDGGYMHRDEIYRKCKKDNVTPHQLRHAYVTLLYNANIDDKTAMANTGHSNISTMRDIYTHISTENRENAKNKLDDFIGK